MEDAEVKKEKPIAVGNIQLSNGKANIMTDSGMVPYDLAFVAGEIRKALKGPCRGYFADKLRYAGYLKILESEGIDGIDRVLKLVNKLYIAKDSNKNLIGFIADHLGRIKQYSKINFAKPAEEPKAEEVVETPALPATEEELLQPADGDSAWVQYWKDLRSFRRLSLEELEAEANDYKRYIKEKTDDNSL